LSGSDTVLSVHLDAGYGSQRILDGVQFNLRRGERIGLVGSSGAGKSTLVLALMGLLPWRRGWARGEVLLGGTNILAMKEREARHVRGKSIALVPQSPTSALNSALPLRVHFEEAWKAHERGGFARFQQRLNQLMDQVHLPFDDRFLARRPGEVSLGQAQRVVLALALLHRPTVLIADEPTSALDPETQMEILDLLRQVNHDDGTALLYISHDLLSVLQLCERIAILYQGRIAECVAVSEIDEKARHPATLSLLRTLPAPPEVLRANARWSTAAVVNADQDARPGRLEEPSSDSDRDDRLQLRSDSDAHR
jgi:peptide/nickel transport system ATP-binding protein